MADEEDYTEESYYSDEEIVEEVQAEAPPARPVHPMAAAMRGSSGGAGAPPPASTGRPVHPLAAALAGAGGKPTVSASRAPPPATPTGGAPAGRPVHPLFGGGGGGGGADKSSMNDQIKMMAAKRNNRVATGGANVPPPATKPKQPVNAVMPPNSGKASGSSATASMAEQVAMLAAQRKQRLTEIGALPTKPHASQGSAPASKPMVTPVLKKTTTPQQNPKVEAAKPTFSQAQLRQTHNGAVDMKNLPAPVPVPSPAPVKKATPAPVAAAAPTTTTRRVVRMVPSKKAPREVVTTTKTTRMVTKPAATEGAPVSTRTEITEEVEQAPVVTRSSGPKVIETQPDSYVTEYKVGCVCTIL